MIKTNDLNDFLNKMKFIDEVPAEMYLVPMDIKSLYINILNSSHSNDKKNT